MNGSIQIKRGCWYAVLYYKDEKGKSRQRWINTGLPERGNKKLAKEFLDKEIEKFDENAEQEKQRKSQRLKNAGIDANDRSMPFGDFCKKYVDSIEDKISPQVYHNYINNYVKRIKKHFDPQNLSLAEITTEDITEFYDELLDTGMTNTSIKHFEDVIRPALKYAYKNKLIPDNPYDFVPTIRRDTKEMDFYDEKEMAQFFEAIKGHKLEVLFKLAAYYGLRRSEILGLSWSAIDFDHKTVSINQKMLMVNEKEPYFSSTLKTKSSRRTLPLIPAVEEMLLGLKKKAEENKQFLGEQYDNRYLDYIFVNETGRIIYPNHVTSQFIKVIKDNNLKKIRFHDLRHSCASIMLKNKVQMKVIQEWLGHSNFATTANCYSHLDYSAKVESAETIAKALSFDKEVPRTDNTENINTKNGAGQLNTGVEDKEKTRISICDIKGSIDFYDRYYREKI